MTPTELHQAIFDQSPNGIYVVDANLRFTHMNAVAEALIGDRAQIIGRTLLDILQNLWSAPDAQKVLLPFQAVLATGTPFQVSSYPVVRRDSTQQMYFDWQVQRIQSPDQHAASLVATFTDVTEHVRSRDALVSSEARFSKLAESVPQLVWSIDVNGRFSYANQRWTEYTGLDLKASQTTDWRDLVHPEDYHRVMSSWSSCFSQGISYQDEFRMRRAQDGCFRWHLVRAWPRRDAQGAIIQWDGTSTDVHELKTISDALDASQKRLRFMADGMPQKIFTASPEGDVDYMNQQWMDFTGLTFLQLSKWTWTDIVHPDDLDENLRLWKQSLTSGQPFLCEHRFRRADGMYRWHLSRAHAMRDASGAILMWIGSNTDIEDLKRVQMELRRSNEDLEHFAAAASHDLQEPLRMISSYVALLERGPIASADTKTVHYMSVIKQSADRMRAVIKALLSYATIGSVLRKDEIASITVVREAIDNLVHKIDAAGGVITCDELPRVRADRNLLLIVFQNLISNAVKFCKGRAPAVRVSARESPGEWVFSVTDNGIGIERSQYQKLFGLFQRLHSQEEYSGTGIGLASCQKIIERHGGRIWVESTPQIGSIFFFTIPK